MRRLGVPLGQGFLIQRPAEPRTVPRIAEHILPAAARRDARRVRALLGARGPLAAAPSPFGAGSLRGTGVDRTGRRKALS